MNPIYLFVPIFLAFTLIPSIYGAYIKLSARLLSYEEITWKQGFRFGFIVLICSIGIRATMLGIGQVPQVLGILIGLCANWLIGSWYFSRCRTTTEGSAFGWSKAVKLTGLAVIMLAITASVLIGVGRMFS